jgi:acyl carrier protein phosphodiesterase
LQGINESLLGVSKIAKFNNNLQNALPLIENNYTKIEDNFLTFFPEIYQESQSFIAQ